MPDERDLIDALHTPYVDEPFTLARETDMKSITLSLIPLVAWSLHAAAGNDSAASKAPETSIPFAQHGGIRDWKADRDRGLWIQDTRRHWHYAQFMGRCSGISFATTIAFDTHPIGTFDRFSSVYVPYGGRCSLQSVTASEGPPRKKKRTPAISTAAEDLRYRK